MNLSSEAKHVVLEKQKNHFQKEYGLVQVL